MQAKVIRALLSKPTTTRALDQICRAVVVARDKARCRRCNLERRLDGKSKQLQWCHVYSRRYTSLRWDLDNSLCLCAECHRWQHQNPFEGAAFFTELLGQAAISRLRIILKTPRKTDRMATRLYLEAKLQEYTRLETFS
jgi:hypothetical protein